jgi:hypothetical protein
MLGSSEEEKTPRRAARQRARRSTASAEEKPVRKAVRRKPVAAVDEAKTVPKAREEKKSVPLPEEKVQEESRKAPTPFSGKKAAQSKLRKRNIIIGVVMIIGIGSSAAVGLTDSGQINVNETIEARNERVRNNTANNDDVASGVVEVPVQNTNSALPNGGLVGTGDAQPRVPVTPPVEELATSTATSSDVVASSTEDLSESEEDEAEDQSLPVDSSSEVEASAEAAANADAAAN